MSTHYNPSSITNGLVLCLDAANKKSYSVNVHPAPVDIYSWCAASGLNNCTITRDTSVTDSPAGGVPVRMTVTGNDPYITTYNEARWNLAPAAVGQTWTASVWAKGTTATDTAQLFMMASASSGAFLDATAATVVVGTSWQRVTASYTLVSTSTAFVQVRLDGPDASGTGTNIWWDGLQVERNPSATAFNPLTNVNGTQWKDLSGNNITMTTSGFGAFPTYQSTSSSLVFSSGAVENNTNRAPLNLTNNITIEAWVNQTSLVNYGGVVMFGTGAAEQWSLNSDATYGFSFGTNYPSAWALTYPTAGSATALNTWTSIAVTFASGSTSWYVNGSLNQTVSQGTSTLSVVAGAVVVVGDNIPGGQEYFAGRISTIRVYNRVLPAGEIAQNYNALKGRFGR